jgi:hypothetical protein
LPTTNKVELKVFDLQGRLVDVINATGNMGINKINYSTTKLQSATYLISLISGGSVKSKELTVTR